MTNTLHLTPAGPPGPDVCAVCRNPLGSEQRYCLHCGARREGARLEFLDVLAEPQGAGRPTPQTVLDATPRAKSGWLKDGSVLAAAVALVGVLLAGLLIGHWAGGGNDDDHGPSTQVIRLIGAGGVAAGAAAADSGVAAADAGAATTTTTTKKAAAKPKAKPAANTFDPDAAPTKVTPDTESKALNDTSGTEDLAPKDTDPNGANFDEIK